MEIMQCTKDISSKNVDKFENKITDKIWQTKT
jgi:hypothetical protein